MGIDAQIFEALALAQRKCQSRLDKGQTIFAIAGVPFATLPRAGVAHLRLTPAAQAFLMSLSGAVVAVSGAAGAQGWSELTLAKIDIALAADFIGQAARGAAGAQTNALSAALAAHQGQ